MQRGRERSEKERDMLTLFFFFFFNLMIHFIFAPRALLLFLSSGHKHRLLTISGQSDCFAVGVQFH